MTSPGWYLQILIVECQESLHYPAKKIWFQTATPICKKNFPEKRKNQQKYTAIKIWPQIIDLQPVALKQEFTDLCILIDWSWCPWRAIMTSASSNTNILIFFGSITWCCKIQSSRVPGVPNNMWSVTFWPLDTEENKIYHKYYNVHSRRKISFWDNYGIESLLPFSPLTA